MNEAAEKPPFREVALAKPDIERIDRGDGSVILRSRTPLGDYDRSLGEMFRAAVKRGPKRVFLAEREIDKWRELTYAQTLMAAESLAQAMLERGLGPDRPLMILSGNSINHGLLTIACYLCGVPVTPVSPAYSLISDDFSKLHHVHEIAQPAMIYVEDASPFAPALAALAPEREIVVAARNVDAAPSGAVSFDRLLDTSPGRELKDAEAALTPDSVAKYLFTSGSTGVPKGVINTHRMLCANQQMVAQTVPYVAEVPPVLVDWLPWNHTFGGNHNFNMVIKNAGTLYIDGGRPVPGQFETTIDNLKEIAPTIYYNVPAGYAQLVTALRRDEALRANFFKRNGILFYAGAALPQDVWDALQEQAVAQTGRRIIIASGWGSTETSPSATSTHFPTDKAGQIGVPDPGLELKLVPAGNKLEVRLKGPNITPGYLNDPDQTKAAFDEEGFYRIGDAAKFVDESDPDKGLIFDGRVAEDFKLSTGTWVAVGNLRIKALEAASPVLQDAVITGHDKDFLGLLAWPNIGACKDIAETGSDDPADIIADSKVRQHVRAGIKAHNAANPGSSTRLKRVLLMAEPPDIDAGEITDKGYINQRAVLESRAHLVERLYSQPPDETILVIDD